VITIVGLLILSFLLDVGAVGERRGFRYWKNPGPFVQYLGIEGSWGRFLGFWSVLINAGFSFIGTEIVAMAAAEARNPRKALPKAVNKVWVRILFFYILGTLAVGVLVPSNDPTLTDTKSSQANKSAFVIAIRAAGIKGLPSVINAALVTSATSAASSDLYTSSRALYSLALAGNAPRIFAKTLKNGLPFPALVVSALFSGLAYLSVSEGSGKVFGWLQGLTSICGLLSWWVISLTYLRFYKGCQVQGIDRKSFPFVAPLQPYLGYWALFWTTIVMLFCGFKNFIHGYFDTADFVTSYFPLPLFIVIWIGYKLIYRTRMVRATEMDFTTGLSELIAAEVEEPAPKNLWDKFWAWI
ncbi:hypothetical protein OC844_008028, partial [Tilletia horrida]